MSGIGKYSVFSNIKLCTGENDKCSGAINKEHSCTLLSIQKVDLLFSYNSDHRIDVLIQTFF